jgi:hypothetical protein
MRELLRPWRLPFSQFCQTYNWVLKRQWLALMTAAVKRGGCYAVDNLRGPDNYVAVRYGYFIYHGRSDPYTACNCYYRGTGTRHSRAEDSVDREIPTLNSSDKKISGNKYGVPGIILRMTVGRSAWL